MNDDMLAMMQQMMAKDPSMTQKFMQDPEMRGILQGLGSAPPAAFEDPQLKSLLDPIRKHKQAGADKFKKRDLDGALTAYQAAVAAAGGTKHGSLAWPQAEKLVFACRSNAALCLLELDRPEAAVAECDLALAMPCAEGSDLLSKVLVRKLQGLIDVSTPRGDILCYLDVLRKRGIFEGKAALVVEQVTRLSSAETGSATERAFDVLTEHWRATKVVAKVQLDAASDRIAAESETTRDGALVRELAALASGEADGKMGIADVISIVLGGFSNEDHAKGKPIEETCKLVRYALLQGGMQPSCASYVDPNGGGNLVWAIGFFFELSRRTAEDIKVLQLLLGILVDEAGADINQRDSKTRLPLMYAVRSGCLLAVQSMLSKGANVHLRDQEGWTPLLCCCMNDVTDQGTVDRVACLQALLDAGADVNSQTLAGGSALMAAVTHNDLPTALIETLLAAGAEGNLRVKNGASPMSYLQSLLGNDEHAARHAGISRLLEQLAALSGEKGQLDVQMGKFLDLTNRVLLPAYNEGIDSDDLQRRKEEHQKNGGPAAAMDRVWNETMLEEDRHQFRDRQAQERRVLAALLQHFGMDATLLSGRPPLASDGNWLAELHRQIVAMVPLPCCMLYRDREPTDDEIGLFARGDSEANEKARVKTVDLLTYDQAKLRQAVMVKYRNRGRLPTLLVGHTCQLIVEPLQHTVGFAVPSEEALLELAKHAPLAEVGAGTGYWSSQLQQRGVDMVAYDSRPPSSDLTNLFFYDVSFGQVLKGDGATLFVEKPGLATRTLVLIWPNNPDSQDSPEFADNHRETVWDADCLTTYMAAGGRKVIYVGERMSQIEVVSGAPPDSGITGSRRFQNLLEQHFVLEKQISIPQWFHTADDLTVWIRK